MDEVEQKVKEKIAASLAIEAAEIKLEARLFLDLKVDSLDLMDIIFALEEEFDIKLRDKELDLLTRANVPLDGKEESSFSQEELAHLRRWLPEELLVELQKIRRREIYTLITVASLIRLVKYKRENP